MARAGPAAHHRPPVRGRTGQGGQGSGVQVAQGGEVQLHPLRRGVLEGGGRGGDDGTHVVPRRPGHQQPGAVGQGGHLQRGPVHGIAAVRRVGARQDVHVLLGQQAAVVEAPSCERQWLEDLVVEAEFVLQQPVGADDVPGAPCHLADHAQPPMSPGGRRLHRGVPPLDRRVRVEARPREVGARGGRHGQLPAGGRALRVDSRVGERGQHAAGLGGVRHVPHLLTPLQPAADEGTEMVGPLPVIGEDDTGVTPRRRLPLRGRGHCRHHRHAADPLPVESTRLCHGSTTRPPGSPSREFSPGLYLSTML